MIKTNQRSVRTFASPLERKASAAARNNIRNIKENQRIQESLDEIDEEDSWIDEEDPESISDK